MNTRIEYDPADVSISINGIELRGENTKRTQRQITATIEDRLETHFAEPMPNRAQRRAQAKRIRNSRNAKPQ